MIAREEEDVLPEGCCDKLSTVGQLVDHVGNGLPVHRDQRLVNLVKQVERSRVTFLIEYYQFSLSYSPVHHHYHHLPEWRR